MRTAPTRQRLHRSLPFAALAVLLCACLPPTHGQENELSRPSVSLSEYRALLTDYHSALKTGRTLDSTTARALARRFEDIPVVYLPSGDRITPNNEAETDTLAQIINGKLSAKERRDARARVDLLLTLTDSTGKPVSLSGDPKQTAQVLLATSDFRDAASRKGDHTLWDSVIRGARWLSEKITEFFEKVFGKRGPTGDAKQIRGLAQFVAYTLYVLCAVGALVGVYYLTRFVLAHVQKRQRKRSAASGDLDLTGTEIADPLGQAKRAAETGDYRGAVRLGYIASLRKLAATGLIVPQDNRTNWEYQRALRSASKPAYDTLLPATRLFDVVWYGSRRATQEAFEMILRAHDALPDAPPSAAATPSSGNSATPTTSPTKGNRW